MYYILKYETPLALKGILETRTTLFWETQVVTRKFKFRLG